MAQELSSIKREIASMAGLAQEMLELTHQAFMEHDPDLITTVLDEENKLNVLEKEITKNLVGIGKESVLREVKSKVAIYADIVGDIELIGDYCKDILERVQIKIEERLLFSEDAVREYNDLYQKSREALKKAAEALDKDNPALVNELPKDESRFQKLIGEYRKRHNQRLISGACSPLACNMFLNMLDFTGQIFYHTVAIARNILKLK